MTNNLVSSISISNCDSLRNIFIDKIISIQNELYPLNIYTAHLIVDKNPSLIKSFLQDNPPHVLTVDDYNILISSLTQQQISKAQVYLDQNSDSYYPTYVLLGSKVSLRNLFFDFYPSVFSDIFNYLIFKGSLKQVGNGKGYAFLFYPSILDLDFSDYTFDNHSDDIAVSFVNFYNSLKEDNQYLESVIKQKDEYIEKLEQRVQNLDQQNYVFYHSTWR
jgi:hypothetical protein